MASRGDCCQLCLKTECHVQHRLRECPELQSIGRDACRDLVRAYMSQRCDVARQVIEKAVGCRLCRAQGHWYVPTLMALCSSKQLFDVCPLCHVQGHYILFFPCNVSASIVPWCVRLSSADLRWDPPGGMPAGFHYPELHQCCCAICTPDNSVCAY